MASQDQIDVLNPQIANNDNLELDQIESDPIDPICRLNMKELSVENNDLAFFIVRCFTLFFCFIGIFVILVNICRGNRLKSWPLYLCVTMSVFCWIAMTLYQEKIDEFCLEKLKELEPLYITIYWAIRNFLHGFSLYLILILLAHLSDIENKRKWVGLILALILIPLAFSVGLIIFDLQVKNLDNWIDFSNSTGNAWSQEEKIDIYIGIESVRILLYNIITTILLFVMSKSFCTSRLYGTFSEKRNEIVVIVTRWTYSFLLIYNLVSIGSYVLFILINLKSLETENLKYLELARDILIEVELFTVVLSVPTSYVFGMIIHCCCGVSESQDMEMNYLS